MNFLNITHILAAVNLGIGDDDTPCRVEMIDATACILGIPAPAAAMTFEEINQALDCLAVSHNDIYGGIVKKSDRHDYFYPFSVLQFPPQTQMELVVATYQPLLIVPMLMDALNQNATQDALLKHRSSFNASTKFYIRHVEAKYVRTEMP